MKRVLLCAALAIGCQSSASPSAAPSVAPRTIVAPKLGLVRLPVRANEPLRVQRESGVWVDVVPLGARDVVGEHSDDRVVYREAFADTELVQVVAGGQVEELRHVRRAGGDRSLHYHVELGPELVRLRAVNGMVEALDADGVARLRVDPAWVVDATGEKFPLTPRVSSEGSGWRIDYAIDDRPFVYPITIDPAWTSTASLATPRRDHKMHVLPSGKVLAISGNTGSSTTKTVEMFDPATSSWTAAGNVLVGRWYFDSVVLSSGKVFIAGDLAATTSVELFDPATGSSTALAPPTTGLEFPSVTLLSNGKVLAVDGNGAQLYDPPTNTWSVSPGATGRYGHHAATFATGKVLYAGGAGKDAQIYDVSTNTWKTIAPMNVSRANPEVLPLPGGKVLVAGGAGLSSAEVYDPASDKWTDTPPMLDEHSYGASVVLPSGRPMMIAGAMAVGFSDRVEVYDPVVGQWLQAGTLSSIREEHRAVALPSGKVLVTGGDAAVNPLKLAEIFEPLVAGKACIGAAECGSDFCVDGFCCASSACAGDETCAPFGTCRKKNGVACTTAETCASGQCVDGVCCESACGDLCAACDVVPGKCVAVPAGASPHGARGACPGTGACIGKCGGIDRTKCTQFPGTAIACGEASCAAGVETPVRGCDGTGGCGMATPHACDAYACGPTACKTQCDSNDDCSDGHECNRVVRKCVASSACVDDVTLKGADGVDRDCTPYRCNSGKCIEACESSESCAPGYLCDEASKRCVVAQNTGDQAGCAFGRREGAWVWGVVLAALVRARRARGR